MSNPIVQFLKQQIGQFASNSPSGVSKWLNGTLLDVEEGKIKVELVVREDMLNPAGTLHGGMAALIMDEVIGMTVFSLHNENFYTSINLAVDFLKTAKIGEVIIAQTQVVRHGRNIVNVKCEITNSEGRIISNGLSNLIRTENKNPFYQG